MIAYSLFFLRLKNESFDFFLGLSTFSALEPGGMVALLLAFSFDFGVPALLLSFSGV
jgi:hypothetical protein